MQNFLNKMDKLDNLFEIVQAENGVNIQNCKNLISLIKEVISDIKEPNKGYLIAGNISIEHLEEQRDYLQNHIKRIA